MALHFLVDDAGAAQRGGVVSLTGGEAKHAQVRRVRLGETVTVGDGRGTWLETIVLETTPGEVQLRVVEKSTTPHPSPRILLAQALAKGDRDELAVQASCELGVDEIVPWQAARSISRWDGAKAVKGRERWYSIAREAAKQAHRQWVPEVAEAETTAQLAARAATQRVLLLDPEATVRLSELAPDARDVLLVVGPEGGIAPEEREKLAAAGAERVRLGETVLRTSTAGPAAVALLSVALGRW